MKGKKLVVLITAIFAVFALSSVALATNRVEVKVTSEPIKALATCDKGGGFSIQFDSGTILQHGDQITIDLEYVNTSQKVTLCRDIDLLIADVAGATLDGVNLGGWDAATLGAVPNQNCPVTWAGTTAPVATQGGVFFHVYGTAGTGRITVDILGEDQQDTAVDGDGFSTLTVGPGPDDVLTVQFLDQKTNADDFSGKGGVDGIWIDGDGTVKFGAYTTAAKMGDNTLCIDVSMWTIAATVKGNVDSKYDKFTFIPSNPQIAHITSGADITKYVCKGATCGNIVRGTAQQQGVGTCNFFDNETVSGYCTGTHSKNYLVIYNSGGFEIGSEYQVELKVLVNGTYGDKGVYFSNVPVATGIYTAPDLACAPAATNTLAGTYTYKNSAGSAVTPIAPITNSCSVASTARATYLLSPGSKTVATALGQKYLYIDLPSLNYDLSLVNDGDLVEIQYSLLKAPCGTLTTGTQCIGTFGCSAVTALRTLLFPYFTPMNDDPATDAFWDGIVIENIGATAGEATLTIYEMDGDVGEMKVNVNANSMYVNLLSQIYNGMTLKKATGSGKLGDARAYIRACANFNVEGFAMMGDNASGTSMGYLPRNAQTITVNLCQ